MATEVRRKNAEFDHDGIREIKRNWSKGGAVLRELAGNPITVRLGLQQKTAGLTKRSPRDEYLNARETNIKGLGRETPVID